MLLSARILLNVCDVNTFEPSDEARFTEGDTLFVYLQLIDLNKDRLSQGFKPSGKRYVPVTGATLQVTIPSIDVAKTLIKIATQPFVGDSSIWRFQILSTDSLKGTYSLQLELNEGGVITHGVVKNGLSVDAVNSSFC